MHEPALPAGQRREALGATLMAARAAVPGLCARREIAPDRLTRDPGPLGRLM